MHFRYKKWQFQALYEMYALFKAVLLFFFFFLRIFKTLKKLQCASSQGNVVKFGGFCHYSRGFALLFLFVCFD